MPATLAIAISPKGVEHFAVLRPDPEGRTEAIALFQAIAPAVDEFDRRVKELAAGMKTSGEVGAPP